MFFVVQIPTNLKCTDKKKLKKTDGAIIPLLLRLQMSACEFKKMVENQVMHSLFRPKVEF